MASSSNAPGRKHRAGRYVKQPTGYRAFIPAPLPPTPPVEISGEMQVLLSRADRELGRLDGSIYTLPNADLFLYMYIRKEAVLSSQIEGTQSSLQDVLAAEAKILAPTVPADTDEVLNYIKAMNHGLERLEQMPVSLRLIRELHKILVTGTRGANLTPGEFRTSQNWIGPTGCTINEAAFVPPPPNELTNALSALERFLHSDTDLPLLLKIGMAHAQFETIHPFLDGNGRIGRLLITFLLCERQVLVKPALYLSYYFKKHRWEYYDHLQAVRDAGDWESWLKFFLKGVEEISRLASATARRILELREQHRNIIASKFGQTAGDAHRVLEYLYKHPITSVNDVRDLICKSYPTANNLVDRFQEADILSEFTGHARHRKFIYGNYIELFDDTTPTSNK